MKDQSLRPYTEEDLLKNRHQRLVEEMRLQAIDVAFFIKPHNVFYLSGYASVCSGFLIGEGLEPAFCTLWLDLPEAHQKCKGVVLIGYKFPGENLLDRMIRAVLQGQERSCRRIGIEKDSLVVRQYELIKKNFPRAELIDVTPIIDRLRAIKDPEEISKIKRACEIADQAMEAAIDAVAPGVSELDVAAEAEYVMRKKGASRAAFGTFVASGSRTLLAHPYASSKRINPGEMVVIDLGAVWEGYSSDLARTTFAGEASKRAIECLKLVFEAQKTGARWLRPGVSAAQVYNNVYNVFAAKGMGGYLPEDIGYGVGLRQSEFHPVLEKGSFVILQENMVIALLQTTLYHRQIGAPRVEDTFLVTATGNERLTNHCQLLDF